MHRCVRSFASGARFASGNRLQHGLGVFGLCAVPANHVAVVSMFGAPTGTVLSPGLGVYLPLLQRVTPVSCAVQNTSVDLTMYTKDQASVKLSIMIQWRVSAEQATDFLTKLSDPKTQMVSYVEKELRTVVSRRTLQELFGQQGPISEEVEQVLSKEMATYGLSIVDTQINSVEPERAIRDAMAKVVSGQRELEAARYAAEAMRVRMTAEAEAEAIRKRLQGEGTAAERHAVLHGLEEDVKHMSLRLGITPAALMEYVLELQRLDAATRVAVSHNAKVIMWPESSSRAATLALETANTAVPT